MNLKNYLVKGLFCLSLSIFTISCSNDDNGKQDNDNQKKVEVMSPKEAKVFVENNLSNFSTCIERYESGAFGDFFYNYIINEDRVQQSSAPYNWIVPQDGKSEWINDVINKWKDQYGSFLDADKPFNLAAKTGVYTWNSKTHKFIKETKGSAFVLIFPSDRSETDLDLKLEIKKYVDAQVSFEGEKTYYPMNLDFSFYKKDVKIISGIAKDIKFEVHDNFSMPISGDIVLYTNPVTHTINLTRETPTVFNLSEVFTQEGGCKTAINAKVHFINSDYGNFSDLKKDVNFADLKISHNEMVIKININIKELSRLNKDFDDLNENEFKSVIKAELFKNNAKAGDLMLFNLLKGENNKEKEITLVLSDGSTQDLMPSFKDEVKKLEKILKRFIDNDDEK
ncbi:hypothetical protein KRX57_01140 [Weeksellaceae bacterium TAE3-ERU29]|nr:hypothetical protein [Weeksellaceae bacterium TAE3-ERU29]